MLALKERQVLACAGKDTALQRQREALANVRLADVFGMQVGSTALLPQYWQRASGWRLFHGVWLRALLVLFMLASSKSHCLTLNRKR